MAQKPDRAPTSIWALRRDNLDTYVQTDEDDTLNIIVDARAVEPGEIWGISRADARLLAKRINQCLDATRGR